jgi:hypothetical protein
VPNQKPNTWNREIPKKSSYSEGESLNRVQLRMMKMAHDVADGKIPMSKYREAEKKHNKKLYAETKK